MYNEFELKTKWFSQATYPFIKAPQIRIKFCLHTIVLTFDFFKKESGHPSKQMVDYPLMQDHEH